MTWVSWRLQRTETLIAVGILALLAALLVPTGIQMANAYHQDGLAPASPSMPGRPARRGSASFSTLPVAQRARQLVHARPRPDRRPARGAVHPRPRARHLPARLDAEHHPRPLAVREARAPDRRSDPRGRRPDPALHLVARAVGQHQRPSRHRHLRHAGHRRHRLHPLRARARARARRRLAARRRLPHRRLRRLLRHARLRRLLAPRPPRRAPDGDLERRSAAAFLYHAHVLS